MCNILDETAENVSDHLALNLQLDMSAPEVNNVGEYYTMPEYPRPKWDDSDFCQNYSKEAKLAFSKLKPWDLKTVTHSNAKQTIDKLCNKLSEILHHSVKISLRNIWAQIIRTLIHLAIKGLLIKIKLGGIRIVLLQGGETYCFIIFGKRMQALHQVKYMNAINLPVVDIVKLVDQQ